MTNLLKIMEPLLPKTFDQNEIFVITITLLTWTIFILLQLRGMSLLKTEIIALFVFNWLFSTVGDRILAEPPIDFYDTLDYGHGELFDSILQIFVYPIPIILFVHFYQKHKPNKIIFILACSLILIALEWSSQKYFNVFQYKEWKIVYSFIFYCFAVMSNLIFVKRIQRFI